MITIVLYLTIFCVDEWIEKAKVPLEQSESEESGSFSYKVAWSKVVQNSQNTSINPVGDSNQRGLPADWFHLHRRVAFVPLCSTTMMTSLHSCYHQTLTREGAQTTCRRNVMRPIRYQAAFTCVTGRDIVNFSFTLCRLCVECYCRLVAHRSMNCGRFKPGHSFVWNRSRKLKINTKAQPKWRMHRTSSLDANFPFFHLLLSNRLLRRKI